MPLEDSAFKRQIQRGDQIECKFLYKDMLVNIMQKEGPSVILSGSGSDHSNYQLSDADMVQTSRSGQGDPRAGEQGDQDQDEWTSQGPGLDPGQRC